MTHFGVISPPVSGHLNPMIAVGLELKELGHQVTFIHMPDVEAKILKSGLSFCVIGLSDHPTGSLSQSLKTLGTLNGLTALKFAVRAIQRTSQMFLRDAPAQIKALEIDALLVDQTEPVGGTIAEYLGIPFITLCCALAINRESKIPPVFTPWHYNSSIWAQARNHLAYEFYDRVMSPVKAITNIYREKWGLQAYQRLDDSFSPIAQLSQQPAAFDYPRVELPKTFHYVGPFRSELQTQSNFPYDNLNGKPLVYASLGTQQNTKVSLFKLIAEACSDQDVQLVIAHANGLNSTEVSQLQKSALVVDYAPQFELLRHASLTITHSGLNTVLDSLCHGVPLVGIPITYEQPAIAARIRWSGIGEFTPYQHISKSSLQATIIDVLRCSKYKSNAVKCQKQLQSPYGAKTAASIIEACLA